MSLVINSTKNISQRQLVVEIVDKVKANPKVFKYIARIFSTYKKNSEKLKTEIYQYIDKVLESPRLNLDSELIIQLSGIIKEIYELDLNKFNQIRGEILENVVYLYGPVSYGLKRNIVYIEPVVEDKGMIVGESDVKCDFVFLYSKSCPIEFDECKADIGNVIPKDYPFEKAKPSHRNKVIYLDNVYKYLKENYCVPKIYFACYNLNYQR